MVKTLCANSRVTRDAGFISGLGRFPGEGHGNPLQYSCLANPMDRGPGRPRSIGSQRVRNNLNDLVHAHTSFIRVGNLLTTLSLVTRIVSDTQLVLRIYLLGNR